MKQNVVLLIHLRDFVFPTIAHDAELIQFDVSFVLVHVPRQLNIHLP